MWAGLEWRESIVQGLLLIAYQVFVRPNATIYAIGGMKIPFWAISGFAGFLSGLIGGMLHNIILPQKSKKGDQKYKAEDSALLSVIAHALVYVGIIWGLSSFAYIAKITPLRLTGEAVGSNLIANYVTNFLTGRSNIFY